MNYKLTYGNDHDGREVTYHDSITSALNSIGEGHAAHRAIEAMRDINEYSGWRGQNFYTIERVEEE